MSRLFVIARYKEDISWLENINNDIVIFNKGDNFSFNYPRFDVPNVGRECETYLRAIIQYYEILDNYESVVFLQGHPFDHCKELFDILQNSDDKEITMLSDIMTKFYFPSEKTSYGLHESIISRLFNINYNWEVVLPSIDNQEHNFSKIIENSMALCHLLGIKSTDCEYFWCHGAQYIVPVSKIKSKSLEWWKMYYDLCVLIYRDLRFHTLAYTIESIWPLVWEYKQEGILQYSK